MAINIGNKKCQIYIGNTKVSKIYLGGTKIYSSGSTCTYICDGNTYQEEVDGGESCLSPKTFTPAKSGWEFAGWRQDTEANGSVLSGLVMGDAPITLYAVFRQTITLSYNGNSATGGSTAAQTGYRYYNNGNVANPSFTLRSNGFSRTSYTFSKWALNSASGTQYAAGASVTLAANATMYAIWVSAAFNVVVNGVLQSGNYTYANRFANPSNENGEVLPNNQTDQYFGKTYGMYNNFYADGNYNGAVIQFSPKLCSTAKVTVANFGDTHSVNTVIFSITGDGTQLHKETFYRYSDFIITKTVNVSIAGYKSIEVKVQASGPKQYKYSTGIVSIICT